MLTRERFETRPVVPVAPEAVPVPRGGRPAPGSPPDGPGLLSRLFWAGVGFAVAVTGFALILSVFLVFVGLPLFVVGLALMQSQAR